MLFSLSIKWSIPRLLTKSFLRVKDVYKKTKWLNTFKRGVYDIT